MMLGEIRTHHPEGAPEEVALVELTGRPFKALCIPRKALEPANALPELSDGGVYFLLGPGHRPEDKPRVFIGSASDLAHQLLHWNERQSPFPWHRAVAFPLAAPRVPRFHKELNKLVQLHCHRGAVRAQNHEVINQEPTCPSLVPAFIERDIKASRTAIQTLLFALGHPVLGTRPRVVS
ncbi:hypothetical protein [Thiohalorhabdus methylotrophus]|uniref:GIY-YIG nuclease family protein n=1 Tax=Thiohalorhabdus methylotrophus TaxID=3242694 RepID=A0ABV4TZ12_9GAMM